MDECQTPAQAAPPALDADAVCAECGVHGALAFDGVGLCPACYSAKGACCAGEERPKDG